MSNLLSSCKHRRRGKLRTLAVVISIGLAALTLPTIAASSAAAASSSDVVVTQYPSAGPAAGIAVGPDGALWFTGHDSDAIGRITTDGSRHFYGDPSLNQPFGIVAGPDGALWFTNYGNNSIGRITVTGAVTNYTAPSISRPSSIAAGSDGALWFTNNGNNSIGRITVTGAVTNYTAPSIVMPFAITAGPDGALWVTTAANNSIERISTGGMVTQYTDTSAVPFAIVAGPDGALWFTSMNSGVIGRIATTGTITNYTYPKGAANEQTGGIASGPDGALWFTNVDPNSTGSIGRITTSGIITSYTDPGINNPYAITAGPDAALWFTNQSNSPIGTSIGRITFAAPNVLPDGGEVVEPTSATTNLRVQVSLSHPSMQTVTAQWNTIFIAGASDVQATPNADYTPATGTVTFAPGQTSQTVPIQVHSGTLTAPYKIIVVSFHNPTNATMGGYWGLAFGFILNNTGQTQTTLNPATLPKRAITALTQQH